MPAVGAGFVVFSLITCVAGFLVEKQVYGSQVQRFSETLGVAASELFSALPKPKILCIGARQSASPSNDAQIT